MFWENSTRLHVGLVVRTIEVELETFCQKVGEDTCVVVPIQKHDGTRPLPWWIVYVNYGNRRSWWCCDRYAGESAAVRGGPDVSTVY